MNVLAANDRGVDQPHAWVSLAFAFVACTGVAHGVLMIRSEDYRLQCVQAQNGPVSRFLRRREDTPERAYRRRWVEGLFGIIMGGVSAMAAVWTLLQGLGVVRP